VLTTLRQSCEPIQSLCDRGLTLHDAFAKGGRIPDQTNSGDEHPCADVRWPELRLF
jgi:hypothetical protein